MPHSLPLCFFGRIMRIHGTVCHLSETKENKMFAFYRFVDPIDFLPIPPRLTITLDTSVHCDPTIYCPSDAKLRSNHDVPHPIPFPLTTVTNIFKPPFQHEKYIRWTRRRARRRVPRRTTKRSRSDWVLVD